MKDSEVFSRLMDEFGNLEQEDGPEADGAKKAAGADSKGDTEQDGDKKANAALMQAEERNTGSVAWITYAKYLRFAGGVFWAPVIVTLLALAQGAAGMSLSHPCSST
jgi:ATP-binding cassette subfamily C (CFTR/MRP) protein 1